MRYYEKQKEIENMFIENGFSRDEFVVGTGTTFTKKVKNYRFEFCAKGRKQVLNKTAKYAVKYFAEHDFYILWNTRQKTLPGESTFRTVYSIDTDLAFSSYEENKIAKKGVMFKWRLKEKVAVMDLISLKKAIHDLSQKEKKL